MLELKRKQQQAEKAISPEDRIQWLLDFIKLQQDINPTAKSPQEGSFEIKRMKNSSTEKS